MKDNKIKSLQESTPRDEFVPDVGVKKFQSITRIFLTSEKSKAIFCPHCGSVLNFGIEVEWMGPDAFLCSNCDKLLHMSLIYRALKDLGIE
jgi:hypothetical protein